MAHAVMELLGELHREGLTIVLVTHDRTVASYADRLLTVRDGRLVGGARLGAAIITGSFVVGDTVDGSIRQLARQHLGPVDELVVAKNHGDWSQLRTQTQLIRSSSVDGVLPIATLDAAAVSGASGEVLTAPRSQVIMVDFRAARAFGHDPRATGISGPTPRGEEAAVTTDLAKALQVGVGSVFDVNAYGATTHL